MRQKRQILKPNDCTAIIFAILLHTPCRPTWTHRRCRWVPRSCWGRPWRSWWRQPTLRRVPHSPEPIRDLYWYQLTNQRSVLTELTRILRMSPSWDLQSSQHATKSWQWCYLITWSRNTLHLSSPSRAGPCPRWVPGSGCWDPQDPRSCQPIRD